MRPGLYRLDIVIKDVNSGNVGAVNERLAVPRYDEEKLEASTLILADQIEHVPAKQIGTGQFVWFVQGAAATGRRFHDGRQTRNLSAGVQPEADEKTQRTARLSCTQ